MLSFKPLAHTRPAYLWDDAALEGLANFTHALWLDKMMRGF
jgi:hypothetical protein